MTSGTANKATAPAMASPAPALAPATLAGASSAARASGPPNDVTARPVKAHPLAGRPGRAGRPASISGRDTGQERGHGRSQPQLPPALVPPALEPPDEAGAFGEEWAAPLPRPLQNRQP